MDFTDDLWRSGVMGAYAGPDIVENGLVLALDAGNSKSYPGTGTTWTDLSGRGNNGTLTNMEVPGDYTSTNGGILTFDGFDEYAKISSPSPLSSTKIFTFEIWVNFTSITGNFGPSNKAAFLFAGGTGSGSGQPEFGVWSANASSFTPNTLYFGRGAGGTSGSLFINVSSLMSNGNWYQIVLVRSTSNAQIVYLNGSSIGTGNVSDDFQDGQTDFGAIHANGDYSGFLNGKISTIKIYNRALTAQEIQQNFNATRSRYSI